MTGDQSQVLPTDTQKNTAFAYAKLHGISSIEDYALALGRRLVEVTPAATECEVRVEEYAWDRIGDHSFVRRGGAVRTAFVTVGRDSAHVESGVKELVLMNSTDSEFKGFLKDEFTTLAETDDRILATSLVATWRHTSTDVDWTTSYDAVLATLLEHLRRDLLARAPGDALRDGDGGPRGAARHRRHLLRGAQQAPLPGRLLRLRRRGAHQRRGGVHRRRPALRPDRGDRHPDRRDDPRGAPRLPGGAPVGRRRAGRPALRRPRGAPRRR